MRALPAAVGRFWVPARHGRIRRGDRGLGFLPGRERVSHPRPPGDTETSSVVPGTRAPCRALYLVEPGRPSPRPSPAGAIRAPDIAPVAVRNASNGDTEALASVTVRGDPSVAHRTTRRDGPATCRRSSATAAGAGRPFCVLAGRAGQDQDTSPCSTKGTPTMEAGVFLKLLFGWVAPKVADSIVRRLCPPELFSRLMRTARSWAAALPNTCELDPRALLTSDDRHVGPAQRRLSKCFIDSRLPTNEDWHRALCERWRALAAQKVELQPFFNLPADQACDHLRDLADRLATVCSSDEKMYRSATAGLPRRILDWRDVANEIATPSSTAPVMRINEIEDYYLYSIHFHLHNPTCRILLVQNLEIEVRNFFSIPALPEGPAAPVVEYSFRGFVRPTRGRVPLEPLGPRRFHLKPGETEFFHLLLSGESPWSYVLRLVARTMELSDGKKGLLYTPDFCVSFREG